MSDLHPVPFDEKWQQRVSDLVAELVKLHDAGEIDGLVVSIRLKDRCTTYRKASVSDSDVVWFAHTWLQSVVGDSIR